MESADAAIRAVEGRQTSFEREATARMDRLEGAINDEEGKRERQYKYIEHLFEDVQARYHEAMSEFAGIKASMVAHLEQDRQMTADIKMIEERMRVIERLTWIGVGGITVIASFIGLVATGFLRIKGMG